MLKVRGHQRIALNRLNGKCIQSFRAALQSHSIFISSSSLVVSASITRGLTYFRIALPNGTRLTEVLCVGFDDAAMRTRRLILERAGHVVTQARDLRQVQAACENTSFAVAVLGQSLNANEKKRVTDIVRRYCKCAKVLELHMGIAPELPDADEHLQVDGGEPEGLVEAVGTLLRRRGKMKARPA